MTYALLAVFSLAFVSCGDDDDDKPSVEFEQIEINGTKYNVLATVGAWTDLVSIYGEDMLRGLYGNDYLDQNEATFSFGVTNGDTYLFSWTSPYEPKRGDILSNMKNFVMEPDITGQKKNIKYSYNSGSAKIIEANVAKEEMTIQFDNLKMVNGNNSFTFKGKVTFGFSFSELY